MNSSLTEQQTTRTFLLAQGMHFGKSETINAEQNSALAASTLLASQLAINTSTSTACNLNFDTQNTATVLPNKAIVSTNPVLFNVTSADTFSLYSDLTNSCLFKAKNFAYMFSGISPSQPTQNYFTTLSNPSTNYLDDGKVDAKKRRYNNEIQNQINEEELRRLDDQQNAKKIISPFAPEATVPLPFQLKEFGNLGTTVWKRNERERYRVRCVNEGYERLRTHLPLTDLERRLSKVDTLRLAIYYIRHMQYLLNDGNHNMHCNCFTAFRAENDGNVSFRAGSSSAGSGLD